MATSIYDFSEEDEQNEMMLRPDGKGYIPRPLSTHSWQEDSDGVIRCTQCRLVKCCDTTECSGIAGQIGGESD